MPGRSRARFSRTLDGYRVSSADILMHERRHIRLNQPQNGAARLVCFTRAAAKNATRICNSADCANASAYLRASARVRGFSAGPAISVGILHFEFLYQHRIIVRCAPTVYLPRHRPSLQIIVGCWPKQFRPSVASQPGLKFFGLQQDRHPVMKPAHKIIRSRDYHGA